MMKKLTVKLIALLLVACVLIPAFASCNSENDNGKGTETLENVSNSGKESSDTNHDHTSGETESDGNTETEGNGDDNNGTGETEPSDDTEQPTDTEKPGDGDTTDNPPAHTCSFTRKMPTDTYLKTAATCTDAAVYYYSCTCGSVGDDTFNHGSPKGHAEVVDAAVASTCTSFGKTEGKHCSVCGTVTVEQTITEKESHTYGSNDKCTYCGITRPTEGLKFTLNSDGKSYSVSNIGQATDFKIVIPSEYNSKPVTAIAPSAFDGERWFTDIIIPDSVTSIGEKAFYECTGLINVTLGDGVTSIGENAFYHCTGLKDIKVGTALSEIGVDAFKECTGLLYVHITDVNAWCKINFANATSNPICYTHSLYLNDTLITDLTIRGSERIRISKWAFYTCTALTSLDIQSGVFSIGEQAFYGCSGIETITIGNGVVIVDNSAFADCDNLLTVTVGKDVTTLNQGAFESCDKLTTFVMGSGITNIGDRVFYNCAKLENITWSPIVTSVGDEMLGYCTSLEILDLPISVTYVGERVLVGCSAMETVKIPFIGSSKNLSLGETSQFSYIFGSGTMPTSLKNITVLGGGIDADDFVGCTMVKNITFGATVTAIDTTSLSSCTALEAISVDNAHTLYATENGILYNKAKTQILFIPLGYTGSLTVNSGNLTKALLNGRSQITDITIGAGVTYEDGTFSATTGLKTLTLPTLNTTALALFGSVGNVPASFETLTITSQQLSTGSPELAGCNFDIVLSNKYITGIEVQAKSSAYSDEFWNGSQNKIKVLMNDGTHSFVPLLPSYLSTAHQNLLYTKGTHTVTATYQGFSDNFTVTLNNHTFSGITFGNQSIIIDDVGSIYISGKPSFATVSYVGNEQTTDGNHTVTATVSAPYYDDLVLSATMTIRHSKYNINYVMGNNASQNPNASQYTYGTTFTFADPYYANGDFVGWYSDSGFTEPITQITAGYYGEVTVYAKFNTVFTYEGNTITGLGDHGKTMSEITIPSEIDGTAMTAIGSHAFRNCENLEYVVISSGITDIGDEAFYNCSNLVSVTMPNGIINIYDEAFYICSNLTSVNLPNTLQYIGWRAFSGCYVLENIEIPDSLIRMGFDAFNGCPVTEDENGVSYIDNWAFVISGASITFRDGTIGIADDILLNNKTITELYIPNTVKYIGDYAFYNCTSLKSVTFAEESKLESIGDYAFYNCTSLTSITIPSSVKSIGRFAFYNCTALTEINFNATAMNDLSSSNYVFYDAGKNGTGITVNIGANVTKIPVYLFCSYSDNAYAPKITSVTFAANSQCESIGFAAFYNCTSLTSITIPSSVKSIGSHAFQYCTALTEINFNATAMNDLSSSNFAFYNAGKNGTGITVNIGANVTKIPALFHGANITSIVFAENSQCESIGDYAFSSCTSLTSITIPSSVTSIGRYAFDNCTSLTSITFEDTTTWYRTSSSTDWSNKTGGTQTSVTSASTNATYFKDNYYKYYWYKI